MADLEISAAITGAAKAISDLDSISTAAAKATAGIAGLQGAAGKGVTVAPAQMPQGPRAPQQGQPQHNNGGAGMAAVNVASQLPGEIGGAVWNAAYIQMTAKDFGAGVGIAAAAVTILGSTLKIANAYFNLHIEHLKMAADQASNALRLEREARAERAAMGAEALRGSAGSLLQLYSMSGAKFGDESPEARAARLGRDTGDLAGSQRAVIDVTRSGLSGAGGEAVLSTALRLATLTGEGIAESAKAVMGYGIGRGGKITPEQVLASELTQRNQFAKFTAGDIPGLEARMAAGGQARVIGAGRDMMGQIDLAKQGTMGAAHEELNRQLTAASNPIIAAQQKAFEPLSEKIAALTEQVSEQGPLARYWNKLTSGEAALVMQLQRLNEQLSVVTGTKLTGKEPVVPAVSTPGSDAFLFGGN